MNRVAERPPADQAKVRASTTADHGRAAPNGKWSLPGASQGGGSGVTKLERWCLRRVLQRLGNPPIQIILWNGEGISTSPQPPTITVRIGDRRTLW
jgi:hypothetical protein